MGSKYEMPTDRTYPLTSADVAQRTLVEVGKAVPIIGQIISAGEGIGNDIWKRRVESLLASIVGRITQRSGSKFSPEQKSNLLLACEQAMTDPLFESKQTDYANVTASLILEKTSANEAAEIIDSIRKLSENDLAVLKRLLRRTHSNKVQIDVLELVGIQRPLRSEDKPLMTDLAQQNYPNVMRLQGMGLILVSGNRDARKIHIIESPYDSLLAQEVTLTTIGARLLSALGFSA